MNQYILQGISFCKWNNDLRHMIFGSHVDVFLCWISVEDNVRVANYWDGNIQMPTLNVSEEIMEDMKLL